LSSGEQRISRSSSREEPLPPTGGSDEQEAKAARAANRFDIRRLIGAVFCLYALILIALGIFGSHTVKHKADGINVNLWTGLGMLVFGALMIFWAVKRPVMPEPSETRGEGSGRIRRAPAT
jgi:NADH:ubiquinone oxidoreductase subunit 6 (subunit J)